MATQYDPTVIVTFADKLYAQAQTVIVLSIVIGGMFGGGMLAGFAESLKSDSVLPFGLAGVVIGGLLGLVIGRARAFALKLQAQVALCQMQIEQNTSAARVSRAA